MPKGVEQEEEFKNKSRAELEAIIDEAIEKMSTAIQAFDRHVANQIREGIRTGNIPLIPLPPKED
jgi:ribosome recycling factor